MHIVCLFPFGAFLFRSYITPDVHCFCPLHTLRYWTLKKKEFWKLYLGNSSRFGCWSRSCWCPVASRDWIQRHRQQLQRQQQQQQPTPNKTTVIEFFIWRRTNYGRAMWWNSVPRRRTGVVHMAGRGALESSLRSVRPFDGHKSIDVRNVREKSKDKSTR